MRILTLFDPLWEFFFRKSIKDLKEAQAFMESRQEAMGQVDEHDKKEYGPLYDMGIIDGKSSALLTHISVMLVVLTFLLGSDSQHFQIALKIELVVYAILATLLLRAVDIMGPPYQWSDGNIDWLKEAALRRVIYQSVLRLVWILTIALVLIFVLDFCFPSGIWSPSQPTLSSPTQ